MLNVYYILGIVLNDLEASSSLLNCLDKLVNLSFLNEGH